MSKTERVNPRAVTLGNMPDCCVRAIVEQSPPHVMPEAFECPTCGGAWTHEGFMLWVPGEAGPVPGELEEGATA